MMELDITFEESPWEHMADTLQPGQSLSALEFLAHTENEEDETLEEIFSELEEKGVALDICDLPLDMGVGESALRLRHEHQLVEKGNLLQGLEENDTLRLYLEELADADGSGCKEALLQKHLQGDKNAAPELLNLSLHTVVDIAKTYTGRGVLLMDLIQEGSLGLWQGILQYHGGDFESHCSWWIRQYMARAVIMQARSSGLGQKLRQGMEDYRDVDQRLLSDLGRNPTLQEIAEQMHITEEQAQIYENMITQARTRQTVEAAMEPKEESPDEEQAVEDTAYFQTRQRILELLSSLSQEDAKLLSLRFGLEGGLPLNPQQAGQRLGLTPQEVVEREAAALARLRQQG